MQVWSWTAEYLSLHGLENEKLRGLAEHWQATSSKIGDVPEAADIDIHAFEHAFPHLALVDVSDLEHPRYTAVGSSLAELLGRDPTNQLLERVYKPSVFEEIQRCFARSVSERRPLMFRREFQLLGRSLGYDRLVLPLRVNGMVTRLLIAIYPLDSTLKRAVQWLKYLRAVEEQETRDLAFAGLWAADIGAVARPIKGGPTGVFGDAYLVSDEVLDEGDDVGRGSDPA